jgi:hypothetical protein
MANDRRRNDNKKVRGSRLRPADYTSLNASRETILQECFNTEFKEVGINAPQSLKESAKTNMTKYCCCHRSWGHNTEECYQLQEAIEELIMKGKLSRLTDKGRP